MGIRGSFLDGDTRPLLGFGFEGVAGKKAARFGGSTLFPRLSSWEGLLGKLLACDARMKSSNAFLQLQS